MISSMNSAKCSAILATALAGISAGSLAFVSAVDVRSFLQHIAKKDTELVRSHFQIWWPCGRDWMVPLLSSATLAHLTTWRMTGQISWATPGLCLFLIMPYTKFILGEDIDKLRSASTKEVDVSAKRFCKLHHARLAIASFGFALSLLSLAAHQD